MKTLVRKTSALSPTTSHRAIVFIDGVQATGMRPGTKITRMLSRYGDVLNVDFPHNRRFNRTEVVTQIQSAIKPYERVTLIGVSMGGLLAYDTIVRAKVFGSKSQFDLVLLDSPTGLIDVSDKRARLARIVPAVPTPVWFNRICFTKPPPQTEPLDEQAKEEWREHIRRCNSYPFGGWIRQIRYVTNHPGPSRGFLRGVRMAFVKSATDDIVEPSAYSNWGRVADGQLPLISVISNKAHADLLEWPSRWQEAIETAISRL